MKPFSSAESRSASTTAAARFRPAPRWAPARTASPAGARGPGRGWQKPVLRPADHPRRCVRPACVRRASPPGCARPGQHGSNMGHWRWKRSLPCSRSPCCCSARHPRGIFKLLVAISWGYVTDSICSYLRAFPLFIPFGLCLVVQIPSRDRRSHSWDSLPPHVCHCFTVSTEGLYQSHHISLLSLVFKPSALHNTTVFFPSNTSTCLILNLPPSYITSPRCQHDSYGRPSGCYVAPATKKIESDLEHVNDGHAGHGPNLRSSSFALIPV